jgi:hypothetical protein
MAVKEKPTRNFPRLTQPHPQVSSFLVPKIKSGMEVTEPEVAERLADA